MASLSMSMGQGLCRVEIFQDVAAVERFTDTWRNLLEHTGASRGFASPIWYRAALLAEPTLEPRLFVVLQGHRPLGFLPLIKRGDRLGFANSLSDYNDWIVAPDEPRAGRALFEALLRDGDFELCGLREDAGLTVAGESHPGVALTKTAATIHLADVSNGYVRYLEGRSSNFRSALRRALKKARQVGLETCELLPETLDPDRLPELFLKYHLDRIPNSVNSGPVAQRFIWLLLPDLFRERALRVFALRDGQEILALQLSFQDKNSLQYWNGGFLSKAAAWSPGRLLFDAQVKTCTAEGLAFFDLLRGNESYKHAWATCSRTLCTAMPLAL